jgi:hypothetical protein
MDAPASRGQDADAPIAELVAHAFDHDGLRIGNGVRGGKLIAQVLQQVLCRPRVEIMLARQAIHRRGRRQVQQIVHQPADREAELQRPAGAVPLPEWHLARLTRGGRHEDAVVRDLLDAPRRGAEHECLADPALEHHFLVELADARRTLPGADEEYAEEPAVGDRAAVGDGHALGAFARGDGAGDAVPRDARAQLGELVGRIAARQHVERAVEHRAAQLGERGRAADRGKQRLDTPVVHRRHRHDLLRDDVQRVPGISGRFHGSFVHGLRHGRAGDEIPAEFRKDDAFADRVRLMSAPADPLQAARDRRRRFDLHHHVDGAHVDPELERRRGDECPQRARLQEILDLHALRPRDRSVMRADEGLARQLVQRAGEPLRQPPAVDEDQRRPVCADDLQEPRVNRRPDRRPRVPHRGRAARDVVGPRQLRHVLDRHFDRELQAFPLSGIDDGNRPIADLAVDGELVFELRADFVLVVGGHLRAFGLQPVRRSRQETARLRRAAAASPTGRCAAATARRSPRAFRATAPGARRAWSAPARESRRR